jgi:hypothetical protein
MLREMIANVMMMMMPFCELDTATLFGWNLLHGGGKWELFLRSVVKDAFFVL